MEVIHFRTNCNFCALSQFERIFFHFSFFIRQVSVKFHAPTSPPSHHLSCLLFFFGHFISHNLIMLQKKRKIKEVCVSFLLFVIFMAFHTYYNHDMNLLGSCTQVGLIAIWEQDRLDF